MKITRENIEKCTEAEILQAVKNSPPEQLWQMILRFFPETPLEKKLYEMINAEFLNRKVKLKSII